MPAISTARRVILSVLALSIAISGGGCSVLHEELNNRGGHIESLTDQYWFVADTKLMRILRAYLLLSGLTNIGAQAPKNASERRELLLRVELTLHALRNTLVCVLSDDRLRCFDFDSRMAEVNRSLYGLAIMALAPKDSDKLIKLVGPAGGSPSVAPGVVAVVSTAVDAAVGVATGNAPAVIKTAQSGLDTITALIELGKSGLESGALIAAFYRDSIELVMRVAIDGPTTEPGYRARLLEAYRGGAGDLGAWRVLLDELKSRKFLLTPRQQHFVAVSCSMMRGLAHLTENDQAIDKIRRSLLYAPPSEMHCDGDYKGLDFASSFADLPRLDDGLPVVGDVPNPPRPPSGGNKANNGNSGNASNQGSGATQALDSKLREKLCLASVADGRPILREQWLDVLKEYRAAKRQFALTERPIAGTADSLSEPEQRDIKSMSGSCGDLTTFERFAYTNAPRDGCPDGRTACMHVLVSDALNKLAPQDPRVQPFLDGNFRKLTAINQSTRDAVRLFQSLKSLTPTGLITANIELQIRAVARP
jgi:hypothetical protein